MSLKKFLLVFLLLVLCQGVITQAQLEVGFYSRSCFLAEIIVKKAVRNAFIANTGTAAGLVRLHFHDCFIRGCDASVLINSTPSNTAEKDSPANNPSLRGFEVIDNAKAILETICPETVSCADILAFAARDSVEITGGLGYDVPSGRRDGTISVAADTKELPLPSLDVNQLTQSFSTKGLTQEEMVTLSGAHTIGRSHCSTFIPGLFNTTQDPSLDSNYAMTLKRQCPQTSNASVVVPMNPSSPNIMDVNYYSDVVNKKGLFHSDRALMADPSTAKKVLENLNSPKLWKRKFAAAMVKMGEIGVLTGNSGEIRRDCRKIN